MIKPILESRSLAKSYQDGAMSVNVLKALDLQIATGDKCAIIGPSGSGKSTLLHILGGLDDCTSGEALLDGISWTAMTELERCQARNTQLGFIYQFHHLLPEFSALENVMMPLLIGHQHTRSKAKKMALETLDNVGLSARVSHKPGQLSGGERQRVAIARAIVTKPACVLADEPTGNLDSATAHDIFTLLLELNKQLNMALVVVTHDLSLAGQMDKKFQLQNGILANPLDFN